MSTKLSKCQFRLSTKLNQSCGGQRSAVMQPFAGFGDDHRHRSADIDVDDLNHGVDSGRKPVEEAAVALGWDGAGTRADDRGSTAAARLADAVVCTGPLDCGWRDWMRRWRWREQCWEPGDRVRNLHRYGDRDLRQRHGHGGNDRFDGAVGFFHFLARHG